MDSEPNWAERKLIEKSLVSPERYAEIVFRLTDFSHPVFVPAVRAFVADRQFRRLDHLSAVRIGAEKVVRVAKYGGHWKDPNLGQAVEHVGQRLFSSHVDMLRGATQGAILLANDMARIDWMACQEMGKILKNNPGHLSAERQAELIRPLFELPPVPTEGELAIQYENAPDVPPPSPGA